MTICKQCIHYLVCMHYSPERAKCTQFKDSTKYVEVIRCKDCKYWEQGKDYEPYCNHFGNMMTDTEADDFCSYGERKDNERKAD